MYLDDSFNKICVSLVIFIDLEAVSFENLLVVEKHIFVDDWSLTVLVLILLESTLVEVIAQELEQRSWIDSDDFVEVCYNLLLVIAE